MSINSVSSRLLKIDENLDKLISTFKESEIADLPHLPNEVWTGILKQLTWTELKKTELTCKQFFFIAQQIFKAGRQHWASACPEASQWRIPQLIFEVERQYLYHKQSVFVTFARIMGVERFRDLPVLNDVERFRELPELNDAGLLNEITPEQMTAPIMKGTTRIDEKIQFLAIRYKLVNPFEDEHHNQVFVMTMLTRHFPNDPLEIICEDDIPFPCISLTNEGRFVRTVLLPKLLRNDVLDVSQKEAKHAFWRCPFQMQLV